MLRYILLLLVAFVAAILLRVVFGRRMPQARRPGLAKSRVIKCAHCGVYVPEEEAIRDGDQVYCSREHQLLHVRGNTK